MAKIKVINYPSELMDIIWAIWRENPTLLYENKGADYPVHPQSVIG